MSIRKVKHAVPVKLQQLYMARSGQLTPVGEKTLTLRQVLQQRLVAVRGYKRRVWLHAMHRQWPHHNPHVRRLMPLVLPNHTAFRDDFGRVIKVPSNFRPTKTVSPDGKVIILAGIPEPVVSGMYREISYCSCSFTFYAVRIRKPLTCASKVNFTEKPITPCMEPEDQQRLISMSGRLKITQDELRLANAVLEGKEDKISQMNIVVGKSAAERRSTARRVVKRKVRAAARVMLPIYASAGWRMLIVASGAAMFTPQQDLEHELLHAMVNRGCARPDAIAAYQARLHAATNSSENTTHTFVPGETTTFTAGKNDFRKQHPSSPISDSLFNALSSCLQPEMSTARETCVYAEKKTMRAQFYARSLYALAFSTSMHIQLAREFMLLQRYVAIDSQLREAIMKDSASRNNKVSKIRLIRDRISASLHMQHFIEHTVNTDQTYVLIEAAPYYLSLCAAPLLNIKDIPLRLTAAFQNSQ